MADVIRLLPDGAQGRFDDSQSKEEQNALIEALTARITTLEG